MKNYYFKLSVVFVNLITIAIFNSCEEDLDNSENINELVQNAGYLDEPEHYDPIQVGDMVVATISEDGVDYKKTETNYKYAQRFDSKTQVSFSKKKNIGSSNDIFLGAIIQGKHWRNNGELISIGNFLRKPMTITINGVDIEGNNSIKVYNPSNATMTDAINNLTNIQNFTAKSTNYEYVNKIAHSKQQIGLSFGLHPLWLENIGFDFEIENAIETNTVFLYFKQIYYTISVALPAEPSDFFEYDVDFEKLETKITPENPAGYISSIEYGRIVLVKMTSTSTKTEMKASIEAVFKGLNIGVGIENKNIIESSNFKAQIYGGNSSSIITNLSEVISEINEGLTITNLQSAVPIAYQVNYLDGSSFNTGSVIEYTETDYEITRASSMLIKKVTFTQLPNMQKDYWDDWSDYPDVYLGFSKWNGSDWESLASYDEEYFKEVTSSMLEHGEISWDINFEISDFSMSYAIDAWDYDSSGDDDWMGDIQFNVNSDIINTGKYPALITLYDSNTNVRAVLNLDWN